MKKKMELIHMAINQLIEERNNKGMNQGNDEEEETILLSRLLSQLDSLEKDEGTSNLMKLPLEKEESSALTAGARDCGTKEVGMDEIVKELKSVKRQNLITHCLLSVMIIVTAVWQFSEASLLLNMKEKVTHPIRAVGDVFASSFKWKERKGKKPVIEAPSLPPISVPELLHLDLPHLSLNDDEE